MTKAHAAVVPLTLLPITFLFYFNMDTANRNSSSSPAHAPTSGAAPAKSPSGLSYTSSGASPSHSSYHTSRHTSPDSITATPSSPSQHPALVDLTSPADLHHNLNPSILPKHSHKMDRNPFQSINERRNKLAVDHNSNTGSQMQQQTQQSPSQSHFPPQSLRTSMQQLAMSSRGLASSNWRSQGTADDQTYTSSSRGSSGEYASFDNMSPPLSLTTNPHPSAVLRQQSQQASSYMSPRAENFPQHQLDFMPIPANHNTGAVVVAGAGMGVGPTTGMNAGMGLGEAVATTPTGMLFPNMQLDGIYGYCFDRGNGQYTRLVPVDMLPPLKDIPALQQGCAGMMVLPVPRGLPSNGRSSNTEMVALKSPPNTPTSPSDTIQNRIDTIVASTPPTPPHHQPPHSGGVSGTGAGNSVSHGHTSSYPSTQHFDGVGGESGRRNASGGQGAHGGAHGHNHHNHGNGNGAGGQQPPRRPKIYCDKWVHEGVCAFTQQGCKYKHEMPFDKMTQHQLGLFHGFPAWWKKHQADLSRQRDGPAPVPSMAAGGAGLGIVGAGNGGADGAQELAGLNAGRFMGRGGGGGGGAPGAGAGASAGASPAGMSFIEGKGDGAGMPSSPSTPGMPSWRRSGEHHSSEQKSLGSGRGMTRGVASGMRNPIVSYSSPFGPIAPPGRTFSTGQSTTGNPYSSLESLEESNTSADNGEEEAAGETTRSGGARLN